MIVFGGAAVLTAAVIVFDFDLEGAESSGLPSQFASIYRSAADYGRDVTELTERTQSIIAEVNAFDTDGRKEEALVKLAEAEDVNRAAKEKAHTLALKLQDIVRILNDEATFMQKRALLGIVDVEIALVQEFVAYTQEMQTFLYTVRLAITSAEYDDRAAVYAEVTAVNERVRRINALNAEFARRVNL